MAQDWDIKPRSNTCNGCEAPFENNQDCFSTLVFGEEGYARADLCETCRQKATDSGSPFSVWRGVYKVPPPPEEEALKKETAESLLRHLMEEKDPAEINVVYILAIMLERKKALIERDVQKHDDGSMTRIYEHRKTGETFVVPDPQLRLDQLEHVQIQVIERLGGGKDKEADDGEQTTENSEKVSE